MCSNGIGGYKFRIFITGDTHNVIDWDKLNMENFPEQKQLTKNDLVIITGDIGGIHLMKNQKP